MFVETPHHLAVLEILEECLDVLVYFTPSTDPIVEASGILVYLGSREKRSHLSAFAKMEAESSSAMKRQLDETDSTQDIAKRQKVDDETTTDVPVDSDAQITASESKDDALVDSAAQSRRILHPNPLPLPVSRLGLKPKLPELPPSLEMVTGATRTEFNGQGYIGEKEVGIIGYIGPKDVAGVRGVIKQR